MTGIRPSRPARIALGYLTAAALWILVSDRLVATLVTDHQTHLLVQSWKGIGFVLVTALVLYVLMRTPAPAGTAAPDRHGAVLLGLTFLLLFVLIVATGALAFRQQAASFKAHQHERQEAIAELKAEELRRWIAWRRQQAEFLAADPDLVEAARQLASARSETAARHVRSRFQALIEAGQWVAIGLYAPSADPLLQAGEARAPGPALRHMIAQAAADGGFRFGEAQAAEAAGTAWRLDFVMPLKGTRAVLVLGDDPSASLFPMVHAWPIPSPSSEVLLLRIDGEEAVLVSPPPRAGARPARWRIPLAEPGWSALRQQGMGVFEGRDFGGTDVLAAFASVPGTPWLILAKTDAAEVLLPLRRQAGQIFAMALLAVCLAALFVALLWRSRQLAHAARERQAQAERDALARRFEALFQQARDIILLIDPSGRIVEANAAALTAYGYTAQEIRALHIRDLHAATTPESFEGQFEAAATADGIQFETVHRRKDGSLFPVEISSRVVEIGGQRFLQSFIRDIGERRRTEDTVRRQLDELRRWYAATLGREARILELKAEVNALLQRLGEAPRYGLPAGADGGASPTGDDMKRHQS